MENALTLANQRLADSGTSWRVELRGQRLGLRGPLPPRPGSGKDPQGPPINQRLSLGLLASEAALEEALAQLHRVREQLRLGTFRWQQWLSQLPHGALPPPEAASAPVPAGLGENGEGKALEEALASFQRAFQQDPRRRRFPAGARSTWRTAYQPYLRRVLSMGAKGSGGLDADLLVAVLESYPLASRSRQQCALVLGALAKHQALALPADWLELGRGYGLHTARFRPLPSDSQILHAAERIPNPRWRLVYGLMATYGL
ncbi:MAG: site-specific integrase, partial [Cyanobacteriota bacterium]|nr:site-specific integrase [Cyanobacteriota bacterium]